MSRPIRHLRWYIGGLLFLSTVINYIDRQTLSVLAPTLKTEFQWTELGLRVGGHRLPRRVFVRADGQRPVARSRRHADGSQPGGRVLLGVGDAGVARERAAQLHGPEVSAGPR